MYILFCFSKLYLFSKKKTSFHKRSLPFAKGRFLPLYRPNPSNDHDQGWQSSPKGSMWLPQVSLSTPEPSVHLQLMTGPQHNTQYLRTVQRLRPTAVSLSQIEMKTNMYKNKMAETGRVAVNSFHVAASNLHDLMSFNIVLEFLCDIIVIHFVH